MAKAEHLLCIMLKIDVQEIYSNAINEGDEAGDVAKAEHRI